MAAPNLTKSLLNDGHSIPMIGLGTWQGQVGTDETDQMKQATIHALHSGYRHIDTAQLYGVEDVVGAAIRESGVPREEIFLATKFWGQWHHDPATALQNSLEALKLDYIDLFLMHWPMALTTDQKPVPEGDYPTFVDTWKKMEKLVGPKCKSIGVSNFTQKTLDVLLAQATIVPAVNQIELHAFNPDLRLVPYCQERNIHVTSWSTMGGGAPPGEVNEFISNSLFTGIAEKYGTSSGVVHLSWAVQRGVSVIPKSGNWKRIEQNIRTVKLSDEDMEAMNNAHKTIKAVRLADTIPAMEHREPDGSITCHGWTKYDMGWEDKEGNWLS